MSQTAFMTTRLQEEKQLGALVAVYQTRTTRTGEITFWSIGALFLLLTVGIVALLTWLMVPELNNPFFYAVLFHLNSRFSSPRYRASGCCFLVAITLTYLACYAHTAQNYGCPV